MRGRLVHCLMRGGHDHERIEKIRACQDQQRSGARACEQVVEENGCHQVRGQERALVRPE